MCAMQKHKQKNQKNNCWDSTRICDSRTCGGNAHTHLPIPNSISICIREFEFQYESNSCNLKVDNGNGDAGACWAETVLRSLN